VSRPFCVVAKGFADSENEVQGGRVSPFPNLRYHSRRVAREPEGEYVTGYDLAAQPLNRPFNRPKPRLTVETTGSRKLNS
jgi:hypothetical protein